MPLAGQGSRRKKALVVISDGNDTNSDIEVDELQQLIRESEVMVYAIGIESTLSGGRPAGGFGGMGSQRPDPALATIAEDTGGGYFELTRADDLHAAFARVAEELHRQYAIGFEPPKLDDKMHKIEVRVSTRGMKVRARKEYFARRSRTSSERSGPPAH